MKKAFLAVLLLSLCSCQSNFTGKTLYLLNFTYVTLEEYKLDFVSDDVVEVRTTLSASPYDCSNYKNDSSILKKYKVLHYSYHDGVLEIPDRKLTCKLVPMDNGNYSTNTGEIFYATSIVEHIKDPESTDRINNAIHDKQMASLYIPMLQNNNEPSFIKKNGRIYENPNKPH